MNEDRYILQFLRACNREQSPFYAFRDASRLCVCFRSHARVGVVDLFVKISRNFRNGITVSPRDGYRSRGDLIITDVPSPPLAPLHG